ncbi:MAG TPA: LytTR family DNA-binding domain-containing protein [Anaeromyxobacter sp.]|nr:LytTR family DNA-binding domain-containing protein [Anaeromyxobacter sp.]
MTRLRVVLADDEPMARRRLARLLAEMEDVAVVGECQDADEVLARVREGGVDVLLLDVRMPGLSGLDALALLPPDGPRVILCTAHPDHAVQAFDAGAVDYVLKPVDPARLRKALDRARGRAGASGASAPAPAAGVERLAIPTRQGIVLLDPAEVSHAVVENELVTLHTARGPLVTDIPLQELEARLPAGRFERVHRRALVNFAEVLRLEPVETGGFVARMRSGAGVEVSRQAARELRRRLGMKPQG